MRVIPAYQSTTETAQVAAVADLRARLEGINRRIQVSCQKTGREDSEITLVAVSKTVPPETIRTAIEAGVRVLGENRVQEAATKIPRLLEVAQKNEVEWHFIGHLQSNKARRALELFQTIQSVDTYKLAERLDRAAGELARRLPILIEVNLGGESSKSGLQEADLMPAIEQMVKLDNLDLKGLMAVPPYLDSAEELRPYFRRLRELRDKSRSLFGPGFTELSMGMSHDFEVAIEEGATMVRIGTALFGPRVEPIERSSN